MNSIKKLRLYSSQFFDTAIRSTQSVATGNTVHEDTVYEKSYDLDVALVTYQ